MTRQHSQPATQQKHETCQNVRSSQDWCVYMIEADDGRWYTGITNHLPKRWLAHATGKGARFFRGRKPSRLLYSEAAAERSAASRREAQIKRLTRQQKQALVFSQPPLPASLRTD